MNTNTNSDANTPSEASPATEAEANAPARSEANTAARSEASPAEAPAPDNAEAPAETSPAEAPAKTKAKAEIDIDAIAEMAQLELTPEEKNAYKNSLKEILKHIEDIETLQFSEESDVLKKTAALRAKFYPDDKFYPDLLANRPALSRKKAHKSAQNPPADAAPSPQPEAEAETKLPAEGLLSNAEALRNAPEKQDGQFKIPKIMSS